MRITLSIPDSIARRFRSAIPPRQRSRLVAVLLSEELQKRENALEAACIAANQDNALEKEIGEWQAFDDGIQE
jgi:metal-responsive CopG/Arc/MetJ family transcriptional regulator